MSEKPCKIWLITFLMRLELFYRNCYDGDMERAKSRGLEKPA